METQLKSKARVITGLSLLSVTQHRAKKSPHDPDFADPLFVLLDLWQLVAGGLICQPKPTLLPQDPSFDEKHRTFSVWGTRL